MREIINRAALRLFKILNVVMITLPFGICWLVYYADRTWAPYYAKGNYLVIALFAVLYLIFAHVYDAFLLSISRISELIYSQILAVFISDAIMYVVIWLLTKRLPELWPMILVILGQGLISTFWSYTMHQWYFKVFAPRKTAIIYDVREGMDNLLSQYGLDKKFEIIHIARVDNCIAGNMKDLDGVEVVFLCGIHSHERNIILKYCVRNGITAYLIPSIGDVIMSGAKQLHMLHLPILKVGRYAPSIEYKYTKRVFDIIVSGIALIVFSPIFLITSIAIKAMDGGPVLYKQCRLTQNGKKFNVLKFRSMRVDAEKDGVARLSTGERDDRITPVGKLIRKVRIDELPQLLNILKGDMSIVGPRPERPEIAEQYEKELPEFELRLQAKAGLTGYAQVYGKYNTTPYDKLKMDLMYISKPSFLEDLKIILATIKILFIPESTDGIAEGQTTASHVCADINKEMDISEGIG